MGVKYINVLLVIKLLVIVISVLLAAKVAVPMVAFDWVVDR